MKTNFNRFAPAFIILLALGIAGCRSTNRLKNYDFSGSTVSVIAAIPPSPRVFTDYWYDARVDFRRPILSVLRVGSAVAKQIEADKAEARLDSALMYVDVSERIAHRTLVGAAQYLGYRPINSLNSSDFIMDVQVREYGIAADSWNSAVSLVIEGEVVLLDNRTKKPIWRQHMDIGERVTPAMFGILRGGAGNVLTASALAQLSVDEMIIGFENLADLSADLMVRELREDYYRTR